MMHLMDAKVRRREAPCWGHRLLFARVNGECSRPELLREYWIRKELSTLAQLERNVTMWDKVVQFRRQAQDCKDRAAGVRDPIDEDAWLKRAEEWLALASANEAARNVQNPQAVNAHPASE